MKFILPIILLAGPSTQIQLTEGFHMTPFLMRHTNNFMLADHAGLAKELIPTISNKDSDKDEVMQADQMGIIEHKYALPITKEASFDSAPPTSE